MNGRTPITPCIFGTANGFEIQSLTNVPLNIDKLAFGITRSEVELSDHDECVKIFRFRNNSDVHTWIGLYRKAYEIGFSREGGYYGAGLWLAGITVNARVALEVLKDIADQVNQLALLNGQFQCSLSSITDEMHAPAGLGPLKDSSERYLRGGLSAEALPTAYIPQYGSPREMLDWAQTAPFGEKFRALIIGPESGRPKAASSRLEFYSDLTDVSRKLADDYTLRVVRLEEDKLVLEKALEKERSTSRQLQQELTCYKQHYDQSLQKFGANKQQKGWEWEDFLLATIGVMTAIALVIAGVIAWKTFGFDFLNAAEPSATTSFEYERTNGAR
jgi:hypothetical protein